MQRLAAVAADVITGAPLDSLGQSLLLTEPLPRSVAPTALTFSGGVAEYIFGHETAVFGDIAKPLAAALAGELSRRSGLPLIDPGQRIRATVIGASQFTVQVSGKTIYLPDPYVLPVHNVPVIRVRLDSTGDIDPERLAAAIRRASKRSISIALAASPSLSTGVATRNIPGSRRPGRAFCARSRRSRTGSSCCWS